MVDPITLDDDASRRKPRNLKRLGLLVALIAVNAVLWYSVYGSRNEVSRTGSTTRSPAPYLGFDVSNATIPTVEIFAGGPPKDGIPALSDPPFLPASEAEFMRPDDVVLGFVFGEEARAYPLRILVWHEIVNDTVGGVPIAATYCPLCGTCMVFDRRVNGRELNFGVSGLLYNSDVLMYDRDTESLWSQLQRESVSGDYAGTTLEWLPSFQTTWADWQARFPGSLVLSPETGHRRDYDNTPYTRYFESNEVKFPVPEHRRDLPRKAWVIGVEVNGIPMAFPVNLLEARGDEPLKTTVGDQEIVAQYNSATNSVEVTDSGTGEPLPSVRVYWFAWQAFYPETGLFDG